MFKKYVFMLLYKRFLGSSTEVHRMQNEYIYIEDKLLRHYYLHLFFCTFPWRGLIRQKSVAIRGDVISVLFLFLPFH